MGFFVQGISMIISRAKLSPTDEGPHLLVAEEEHNWLLKHMPSLPMFSEVKGKVCNALRQVTILT